MRVETRVRAAAALDAEIGCREELRVEAIALGTAVLVVGVPVIFLRFFFLGYQIPDTGDVDD